MKQEIEKMIPHALSAVEHFLLKDGIVPKEYDGYAASLGAAIRTSGLVPALSFYTDVNRKEGTARRFRILKAIAFCLKLPVNQEDNADQRILLDRVLTEIYDTQALTPVRDGNRLQLPALPDTPDASAMRKWTNDIIHASVALKLALRNFPHSDDQKD